MKHRALARTILIGLVPSVLGLFFLLTLSNYLTVKRQILDEVRGQAELSAAQSSDLFAAFFNERRRDALELAKAPPLQHYLRYREFGLSQEAETYRREAESMFREYALQKGIYSRIAYRDADGRELAYAASAGISEKDASWRPLTIRGPSQVADSGIHPERSKTIDYVAGVFDSDGREWGRIVLECDLDSIRKVLSRLRLGAEGRAAIVDGAGKELLSSGPSFADPVASQASIAGTSWNVRLMAKPEEFIAPLRRVQHRMEVLFLASCGLMFLWIGYRVREAVRPIEAMAEGTKRLASGDLDYRFNPPPVRELRVLGDAFNDMAGKLRDRDRELQSRIRQLIALREMEGAVIQRLDEESILRTCLKAVTSGLGLERAGLYWVDRSRREIVGRYVHGTEASGLTEEAFQRRRISFEDADIISEVLKTRSARLVTDARTEPRLNPAFVEESKTRSFVIAPIYGKDQVFGVITADNLYSGRVLRESDREGLSLFANAVGLALENATLFNHLAVSEARYRAVIDNSPVAVLGLSREQRITTWNQGAESLFGYRAEEVVGKPVDVLFPNPADKQFESLVVDLIAHGSVRDFSMPGTRKDGRRLELSVSWGGAHKDFWMNREWAMVIRDVGESRRLQQQLIRSEKLSVVGQLISNIAHELNNPLTAVVGYAQIVAEPDSGFGAPHGSGAHRRRFRDDLLLIQENALRCRKIIDNLLFFVRHGEVSKKPMKLDAAARAAAELLHFRLAKADQIEVHWRLERALPRVAGNPQQMQQLFVNLINNACDAMAKGCGRKRLWIRAGASAGWVRAEVEDEGPGISEVLRQQIFEPFFTTKPEGRGTGLGLAICRQIVQDHGGRMGLSDGDFGGAKFWMEFPAAPELPATAAVRRSSLRKVPGKTVLLVDDEPAILGLLCQILEAEGDAAVAAESLAAASKAAREGTFDAVVTDVLLGDGNGLDFCRNWETLNRGPRPKFLLITGDILDAEFREAIEREGIPFLQKPLDVKAFRQALRSLLSSRRPIA